MTTSSFPKPPPQTKSEAHPFTDPASHLDNTGPELIRYANTPEGLLARRDANAIRRYVLQAKDCAEMLLRQQSLWDQSTQTLALWPGLLPTNAIGSETHSKLHPAGVANAQLVAWPFILTLDQCQSIRNIFDWQQGQWPQLSRTMVSVWAQSLGIPPANVRIQEAFLARQLAGISPLHVKSLVLSSCNEIQANSSDSFALNTAHSTPKTKVLHEIASGFDEHSTIGPNQPQVFVLTALVATKVGTPLNFSGTRCRSAKLEMQSILSAVFTHATSMPQGPNKNALREIRPSLVLGEIDSFQNAITQAQGMELAWWAKLGRKTDCGVHLKVEEQGTVLHWKMALSSSEDEHTVVDYCYEGLWRPSDHRDSILTQAAWTQSTGLMESETPVESRQFLNFFH